MFTASAGYRLSIVFICLYLAVPAGAGELRVSSACVKSASACSKESSRIRAEAAKVFGHDSAKADYRVCTDYASCFEKDCNKKGPQERSDPSFSSFKEASRPFVMPSKTRPTKGTVVLVHGLSDSPYTFGPMAESLSKSGYNVVTVLLTGHGADNQKNFRKNVITREKWLKDVAGGMKLAKGLFGDKNISLGGFSGGGALVVDYAFGLPASEQKHLDSLLLFDPAVAVPRWKQMTIQRKLPGASIIMGMAGDKAEVGSNPARIPFATESLAPALGEVITEVDKKLSEKKKLDVPTMTYFTSGSGDEGSGKTIDPARSQDKLKQILSARRDFVNFSKLRHNALMSPHHFAHCAPSGNGALVNLEFAAVAAQVAGFLDTVRRGAVSGMADTQSPNQSTR